MSASNEFQHRIESIIASARIVLFMKGTRSQPQCRYSATVVNILNQLAPDYRTVNVSDDAQLKEAIKAYSRWSTIPQLYVDRKFVGGCDVVEEMFASGDLHRLLGSVSSTRFAPAITVSDAAVAFIREALADEQGATIHLEIDANWNHEFELGPIRKHQVTVAANGVEIAFDPDSARRAHGVAIDIVNTPQGRAISIHNPNAPPPVGQLSARSLKAKLDAGERLHLFDVREAAERERASIAGSRLLDDDTAAFIDTLGKEEMLVFHCHFGARSQAAAEYYRLRGYTNVHNLAGGIDAWSQQVDPDVPRY